jgi:hypothetical protein
MASLAISLHCFSAEALSIDFLNYNIIDFGAMDMGQIENNFPSDGFLIKCTASTGTPGWTLTVKLEHPLTHETNTASQIPNTNFEWYLVSTSDLNNQPTNINQLVEFTTYDNTTNPVYTGLAGEEETDLEIKFRLEIPSALEWGYYDTRFSSIVFTLTE